MANQELFELLKKSASELNGCRSWNDWRDKHPNETIDLTGADLAGAKLQGCNLNNADLSQARLTRSDLSVFMELRDYQDTEQRSNLSAAMKAVIEMVA